MKDALRTFWENWKKFGRFMGDLFAHVFLTLFYFTIFLPFGVGVRLFSDRLDIDQAKPASWHERTTTDKTLDDARRLS